jgi:F420-0:gamma-glutamyl ligase
MTVALEIRWKIAKTIGAIPDRSERGIVRGKTVAIVLERPAYTELEAKRDSSNTPERTILLLPRRFDSRHSLGRTRMKTRSHRASFMSDDQREHF